jgi:2-polyprenyl-6-hydroxyphenyl methylase/3-demethylubiquinone-9 3-methyltransferase
VSAARNDDASAEIAAGERFGFGGNWASFLDKVDDARVEEAVRSLRAMLEVDDLRGQRFLDVGSGSGLFSLAARRLGADVVSFDFDPGSVACTQQLRRRFAPDGAWEITQGSILDEDFVATLGTFDVVYAWGVLHHTGDLWTAAGNVAGLVGEGGRLFVAIYNDQGVASRAWRRVKRTYNRSGPGARALLVAGVDVYFRVRHAAASVPATIYRTAKGIPRAPQPARARGLDRRHDMVDWVGGWPFEVARPEQVFDFFRDRGFRLERLKTCAGGLGNNEFVFSR